MMMLMSFSSLLFFLFHNYDTNVSLTMTRRANFSVVINMLRCDVALFAVIFYLVLPADPACDSDDSVARLYREKFCNLPKIVGSCKLKWKRFYFNRHTRECEQFTYEGEGGKVF